MCPKNSRQNLLKISILKTQNKTLKTESNRMKTEAQPNDKSNWRSVAKQNANCQWVVSKFSSETERSGVKKLAIQLFNILLLIDNN